MSIKVQCESCGMRRQVNERLAGRTIRCPGCEQPLTIPQLAAPESTEEVMAVPVDDELPFSSGEGKVFEVEAVAVPEPGSVATPDHVNSAASVGGATAVFGTTDSATGVVTGEPRPSTHHAEVPPSALLPDDSDEDGMPPRKKRDDGELDMTPMVDVTFLLLIFFMVTASFSLQKSIQMPRQNSDLPSMSNVEEPTEELDPIELEIEENGSFLVLAPEWEKETPGKHNLINALREALGGNKDGMRLDIKVHENAKLQMLVDAMDAGTIAGFTEIQVAEVDGFD
ncbi:biopolymer transport protein ExbD [Rhodopirellula rubra]|uniref:Biopolymer transport protein ExbD n=1 Tax=Aporhodopirellula rubra TaxID=980271 RepID=A0A7W5E3E7_9BACT|nr:biopolymer transporter ExbD [Aporhodopirellula rubra]MBB3208592.1 biopolymer transport protein ExbD [Aporhodopirellula rubra]